MNKINKNPVTIQVIKNLCQRSFDYSFYFDKETKKTRHLEAFLLQATLMEGVLTRLGLELLECRNDLAPLRSKRSNRYGIDNAINDLYLLGEINSEEFIQLEKFKAKRNDYFHKLLFKSGEDIEDGTKVIYASNIDLLWTLIKKLEKQLLQKRMLA